MSQNPSGVPLLDMSRQHGPLAAEIAAAIERVCDSGKYVLGPDCDALEHSLAKYCRVEHAIACASGSDALLLALMAYEVGPGDEVVMPSYTFFATAAAVWRLGARPVMVDIDPVSFNVDPRLIEKSLTKRTKAIIPVHLFGQCADMRAINNIARETGLAVIEDAAQAIGAEFDGRRAGGLGDIGCFSFYPTKNLGCYGDGGLLTTDDAALADKLKLLRGHGMRPRYYHHVVGINSRLDSIQAAILNVKLPHLERWTAMREVNARRYAELFAASGLQDFVTTPRPPRAGRHVWNQYVVRIASGKRDALREHLTKQQIGAEIYYPVTVDQQECFRSLGYERGALAESQRAADETLALPIFPEITAEEQGRVVSAIAEFMLGASPAKAPVAAKAVASVGPTRPRFLDVADSASAQR